MKKKYFCVAVNTNPSDPEKKLPGGGRFFSKSQRFLFYTDENKTEKIGFDTREACENELRLSKKKLEHADGSRAKRYEFRIEELEVAGESVAV